MFFSLPFRVQAMHIPDGFLSLSVSILYWLISAAFIYVALRKTSRDLGERQIPLMGVLAAAIFAGQMLNFTVAGGTSGHLLGAALATILLGPWPAILVMTSVVSVQALVFQDGGLLVLGANIFNMAIVGVFVSYAVYSLLKKLLAGQRWGIFGAGFLAAWSSILIASLSCSLQLAISGTSPASLAIPAMAGIHALIGIGEGLITSSALAFIAATRKDLLQAQSGPATASKGVVVVGSLVALTLAVFSPLASSHPDGLEWVAENLNFLERAATPSFNIIPDYTMPGISSAALATILAGIAGVILILAVALILNRLNRRTVAQEVEEG